MANDDTPGAIHALVLNVISRETGAVEAQMKFLQSEVDMPGYVEHVEHGYDSTPWRTERIWLVTPSRVGEGA